VGGAFLAGLLAASSLVLGSLISLAHPIKERPLGVIMAFGAGVLISAVAYDLVLEAATASKGAGIPLGLLVGALTFFVGDALIDRAGGARRKAVQGPGADSSAKAIVLGTVLDGIPESVVLGVSLLTGEGVSVAVLVAVFLSNLPEAMSASTGLARGGAKRDRILLLWVVVALVSALASGAGYALLDTASPAILAFVQAFAAGAILTMLADTMMPEAFEYGGAVVGLITTLGFVVAFGIAALEHKFG
jgi:zinc transporter, ZIP family